MTPRWLGHQRASTCSGRQARKTLPSCSSCWSLSMARSRRTRAASSRTAPQVSQLQGRQQVSRQSLKSQQFEVLAVSTEPPRGHLSALSFLAEGLQVHLRRSMQGVPCCARLSSLPRWAVSSWPRASASRTSRGFPSPWGARSSQPFARRPSSSTRGSWTTRWSRWTCPDGRLLSERTGAEPSLRTRSSSRPAPAAGCWAFPARRTSTAEGFRDVPLAMAISTAAAGAWLLAVAMLHSKTHFTSFGSARA
mmetsp:Transcript_125690/g.350133  ORF Transcript_125690/g.350133 Transcript_125690/m.350133 type:complete len:250 (-) Transcript_125690:830-1579(-)